MIDFLRYTAFNGRLRGFFSDAVSDYVDPEDATGLHLRFSPVFLRAYPFWHELMASGTKSWEQQARRPWLVDALKDWLGIEGGAGPLGPPDYSVSEPGVTAEYRETRPVELQIIVDVKPSRNRDSPYQETRSYEGVPVIFREVEPAAGFGAEATRLFDFAAGPERYGTMCGVFTNESGVQWALTCGHVVSLGSTVMLHRAGRRWRPFQSPPRRIGNTVFQETCEVVRKAGELQIRLDAAMVELASPIAMAAPPAVATRPSVVPIARLVQEDPVWFRSAGKSVDSLARIAGVTIRKSIDLFHDGIRREVGDVLMLGHRYPMYVAQPVSRPGDSGAAVRQTTSWDSAREGDDWTGMIIGGDDTGAFAMYAEHLWSWARRVTAGMAHDFDFALWDWSDQP